MTFEQAYQSYFDLFTQERNLDQDDSTWPEALAAEFKAGYLNLLAAYGRSPL